MTDQQIEEESPDDLRAETPEIPLVPVRVEGPVNTHQLPSRHGEPRNIALTTAELIAGRDLRRRIVRLHVPSIFEGDPLAETNVPVYIARNKDSATNETGFLLGVGADLEITSVDELWAKSAGALSTLSILIENWAD